MKIGSKFIISWSKKHEAAMYVLFVMGELPMTMSLSVCGASEFNTVAQCTEISVCRKKYAVLIVWIT